MAKKDMEEQDEGPRNFGVILSEIDGGSFLGELGERLQELVTAITTKAAATMRTSAGDMTIKIGLKADEKGRVELAPDCKTKLPAPIRSKSLFYATDGGNLTPTNPKQGALPFREVPGGKQETKEVTEKKSVKAL